MKIERLRVPEGEGYRTARYFVRPGSRRGKWLWLDPAQVPEFEGKVGWFEIERIKGGWKVLHEVPEPSWLR